MVATVPCVPGRRAVTSQLAATRRQAASSAAAFLGLSYAVRLIADAGVGFHGLIWVSPFGWVGGTRTSHFAATPAPSCLSSASAPCSPLVAVALAGGGATSARASCPTGCTLAPSPTAPRPDGLAIRLQRASVIGWWVSISLSAPALRGDCQSAGATLSGSSRRCFPSSEQRGRGRLAVLGACFLILAVLVAFLAAGQVTAARPRSPWAGLTTC